MLPQRQWACSPFGGTVKPGPGRGPVSELAAREPTAKSVFTDLH